MAKVMKLWKQRSGSSRGGPDTPDLGELTDPTRIAARAGLVYWADETPGHRRVRCGTGFTFHTPEGETLDRHGEERARLDSLVIPPAWEDVWVCPDPRGHLQATGRDAAGRKQYLYHPDWHAAAGAAKWLRVAAFGRTLPRLRRRVRKDGRRLRFDRTKVCAIAAAILDATAVRVGGAEYAADHGTFGLTTLRPDHATVEGGVLTLEFVGKHGVERTARLARRAWAKRVAKLKKRGGDVLLTYRGADGARHPLDASKVSDYLRDATGERFTAKDFRSWHGSRVALERVLGADPGESDDDVRLAAVDAAAAFLGNTRAVCREYYVHPAVTGAVGRAAPEPVRGRGLRQSERRLLRLLESEPPSVAAPAAGG